MRNEHKDRSCSTCLKSDVCLYFTHVRKLTEVGTIILDCSRHSSGDTVTVESNGECNEEVEKYKNMTVDEVSKMNRGVQSERPATIGTCEICGKTDTLLYKCDNCGVSGCSCHFEFEDELDLNGEAVEKLYCSKCTEEDDAE